MSPSVIPTNPIVELDVDTEKLAIDKKREQDSNHKWALGVRDGHGWVPNGQGVFMWDRKWEVSVRDHGVRDLMKAEMKIRPDNPYPKTRVQRQAIRRCDQRRRNAHTHAIKWVDRDVFNSPDSSANEESVAPEPDAGITYSFDAAHGPSAGSNVLSLAVNKAVERFENKVTEKLVKDEYDIVMPEDDHVVVRNAGYAADDEDFEFV